MQRNAVYAAIAEIVSDISEFEFDNGNFPAIKHLPSGSEFHIRSGDYATWYEIGDEPPSRAYARVNTFNDTVKRTAEWAKAVSRWMKTPDLWGASFGPGAIPGELVPIRLILRLLQMSRRP